MSLKDLAPRKNRMNMHAPNAGANSIRQAFEYAFNKSAKLIDSPNFEYLLFNIVIIVIYKSCLTILCQLSKN